METRIRAMTRNGSELREQNLTTRDAMVHATEEKLPSSKTSGIMKLLERLGKAGNIQLV